eukprot:13598402-Ditylum_brightwellii.AAC.1
MNSIEIGSIIKRSQGLGGKQIRRAKQNSLLDTCVYSVMSMGDSMERFEVNVIGEYMFAQANGKGHHFRVARE